MKDFWKKRSFTEDDIKSTRALLDVLLPMEEEKIKSNEHGFATIHIYALENNLDLELFLASGLNVNELSRRDKMTALQLAVAQGHTDMVKLLIAYGADMYIQEGETLPPLFIAIQKNDLDMVKILIECGIDPQKKCKCAGTTASALAFALVSQKKEIFEFLRSCENYKNTVNCNSKISDNEDIVCSDRIAISRDYVFVALESGKVICLNHKGESSHRYGIVSSWHDVTKIAAGFDHAIALTSCGQLLTTGNSKEFSNSYTISSWRNVSQIAACEGHTAAVTKDGKVLIATEPGGWEAVPVKYGESLQNFSDIKKVAVSWLCAAALKNDGTIAMAGECFHDRACEMKDWKNIVDIDLFGCYHSMLQTVGLTSTGKVVTTKNDLVKNVDQWENIVSVSCGDYSIVALNNKGKVFFCGYNEKALAGLENWPEMLCVKTGFFRTVGIDREGFIWLSRIGKTKYNFYHGNRKPSYTDGNTFQENLDLRKKWREDYQDAKENNFYKMKNLLAEIYQETIKVVQQGSYITATGKKVTFSGVKEMMANSVLYECIPPVSVESKIQTVVTVESKDSIVAGKDLLDSGFNPVVLNMANRQKPGGGVLGGARAQEEDIFRRTNIFCSMYQFHYIGKDFNIPAKKEHYPMDRNTGGVYSPGVTVFRGERNNGYPFLDNPYKLAFVSVAAINSPDLDECNMLTPKMAEAACRKIRTIFRIALKHGHDSIVLGAWGCGAFKNPPAHIAKLFHQILEECEFKDKFAKVVFAIMENHHAGETHNPEGNLLPFKREFQEDNDSSLCTVNTRTDTTDKKLKISLFLILLIGLLRVAGCFAMIKEKMMSTALFVWRTLMRFFCHIYYKIIP